MLSQLLLLFLICLAAHAQAPVFEAASIKPPTPLGPQGMAVNRRGGPGTSDPGLFTCRNCPLSWLLSDAWQTHGYDFSGPDWLESTRFDFSAKVPAGASREDFRAMLQNLLTERFKLTLHREQRQMPLYELTVLKGGPKFREAAPKEDPKDDGPPGKTQRDADGFPILGPGMIMATVAGHGRLRSDKQSLAWFADMLANQLASPVIDATGLKGEYDFVVSWAWEEDSAGGPSVSTNALVAAIQSQLGLKLERKKGPIDVRVVDHMEKVPTAN